MTNTKQLELDFRDPKHVYNTMIKLIREQELKNGDQFLKLGYTYSTENVSQTFTVETK